jgi:hypothetical protein
VWEHAEAPRVENFGGHRASRWWGERPPRMLGQKCFDLRVVLFGLERAGAVNEEPTRCDDRCRRSQNRPLGRRHNREIAHPQAPTRIGMAPECAGAGARRIDEYRVHFSEGGKAGIADQRKDVREFETANCFTESRETAERRVGANDEFRRARQFHRFAARR